MRAKILKICFIFSLFMVIFLGIFFSDFLLRTDLKIQDLKQLLSLKIPNSSLISSSFRDQIIILSIDESTSIDLIKYNAPGIRYWPLGRDDWARIITYIQQGNPKVLSVSVPFTNYQDNALSTNSADILLASSLRKYDNIVLGNSLSSPYSSVGKIPSTAFIDMPTNPFKPISKSLDVMFDNPYTEQNVTYFSYLPMPNMFVDNSLVGYLNQKKCFDDRVRTITPVFRVISGNSINYVPSFAFATFLKYLDSKETINVSNQVMRIKDHSIPLSKNGDFLVNWHGPCRTYVHIPFSKVVLAANTGKKYLSYENKKIPISFFKDKIIIIAPTQTNLDTFKTPVGSFISGAEINANVIENFISDSSLNNPLRTKLVRDIPLHIQLLLDLSVLIFILANIFVFRLSLISILNSLLMVVVLVVFNLFVYLCPEIRLNFSLVPPLYYIGIVTLLSYLYVLVNESLRKKTILNTYGQIVSDKILSILIKDKYMLETESKKKKITVLACGIENFVAISEKYSPGDVIRRINSVFNLISQVILKHNGTLDKVVSDSIIAYWGDPVSSVADSANAVKAAVEIISEIEKYNLHLSDDDIKVSVSIAIDTDEAIIGKVTAGKLTEISIFGTLVGTVLKMQSICAHFSKKMVISESTYIEVNNFIQADYSGSMSVKGLNKKLSIYSPKFGNSDD